MENNQEIQVFNRQDLTKPNNYVKLEIRKYLDRDVINAKLNQISNQEHRMLLTFMWRSGVRVSEAILLTKGKMDFENYLMTIKWLKNRKYYERVVPLHPQLRDLMQLYTAPMKAEDKVFPFSRQRVWQLMKKYFDKNAHPHTLRHSFAVNWLKCDGDIVILHKILGHSKIQTTMEYLKIVPIDQGKELLKIQF